MHSIDPCFRDDSLWIFAQEDRKIKLQLHAQASQQTESTADPKQVFAATQKMSRHFGNKSSSQVVEKGTKRQRDYYDINFGTDMPKQIVSSDAHFRQARQNLLTLTRQDEDGYVHCMYTYVSNFAHGEILAYRDRGPFARAKPDEHMTYLLGSKALGKKVDHTCPATVTFSYQRRRHHFQERVLRTGLYDAIGGQFGRRKRRSEEQQSRNPHDHYVSNYEKCSPACPRTSRYCLRNTDHKLPSHISEAPNDQVHKHYHAAEIRAELVRFAPATTLDLDMLLSEPVLDMDLTMDGECCIQDMLVGFLQRRMQVHFMLHRHSLSYCMAKGKCRFGAPWKPCSSQRHNEETNRMEPRRRLLEDDVWVSTHNLEALLISGTHVHAQFFCPIAGGRLAGTYTVVYIGKKDRQVKLNTVHSEDSEVSRFLKTRVLGSPMAFYMMNGGEILDLGREVLFHDCLFANAKYNLKSCLHRFARRTDKDATPFSTAKEKYMLRPSKLRHLRIEQFMRYFKIDHAHQSSTSAEAAVHHRHCVSKDHHLHPQHDEWSSALACGSQVEYDKGSLLATRRSNAQLGCMRCLYVEPTSALWRGTQRVQRDVYYEIRLYRALPWFQLNDQIQCMLPLTAGVLEGQSRHNTTLLLRDTGDSLLGALNYELKCERIENLMVNTLCECCEGRRTNPCEYCNNIFARQGFHKCAFEEFPVWKPGTLYCPEENVAETHIIECRERGESFSMIRVHIQRFVADGQMTKETGQRYLRLVAIEMGEPISFEDDWKRINRPRAEQASGKDLEQQTEQLQKVWSFEQNAYVVPPDRVTSQYTAYRILCKIQNSPDALLGIMVAPAGFGKSELVKCFMGHEELKGRKWQVIASSGIAAVNVGGGTIHWFLGMNLAKEIDIRPGSALAERLEECSGIVMDEAFTTDHEVWDVLLTACREYPLKVEKRKLNSVALFGHRDFLLLADHWQTPPANGCAPMLVCGSFQKYFEVFVLAENRRQEKNPAYGKVLEAVKRGGSASDSATCDSDVANMFTKSYVRGFGIDASNVDLEVGRALFPQRHHKDRWNAEVVKRLERECPDAEGIDVFCTLGQGEDYRLYDETELDQRQTKMKFPKILKLRTHPNHCLRLTLLHNKDLEQGLANGQKVRLLPSASWSHEPDRIEVGQDGTVHAKQVDNLKNDKFQVFVAMEKDMDAAAAKGDLGSLRTHTLELVETDIDRYGRQCQIPVELGYASSIHKSQLKGPLNRSSTHVLKTFGHTE